MLFDQDMVVDLRHLNSVRRLKYFRQNATRKMLAQLFMIGGHMAKAIFVGDLREQVKACLPAEMPIPLEPWIRYRHAHSTTVVS